MKKKGLLELYDSEKVEAMIKKRKEKQLFTPDAEFPDDDEEHWYWVRIGNTYSKQTEVSDSMEGVGEKAGANNL